MKNPKRVLPVLKIQYILLFYSTWTRLGYCILTDALLKSANLTLPRAIIIHNNNRIVFPYSTQLTFTYPCFLQLYKLRFHCCSGTEELGLFCGKVRSRIAYKSITGALAGDSFSTFSALTAGVEGGSFHPASLLVGNSEAEEKVLEEGPS